MSWVQPIYAPQDKVPKIEVTVTGEGWSDEKNRQMAMFVKALLSSKDAVICGSDESKFALKTGNTDGRHPDPFAGERYSESGGGTPDAHSEERRLREVG